MSRTSEIPTARNLVRRARPAAIVIALLLAGAGLSLYPSSAEEARAIPAPAIDESTGTSSETAILAGGCFWGVQGVFQHVSGVSSAVSGFAGGDKTTAHYKTVSSGTTGHAESVRITYDPRKISYGRLLQIFFSVAHDPTQLNRQGPDSGTQYRSAVFPANAEQAKVARAYIEQLDKARAFEAPIATSIEPFRAFYAAEGYHQDFLARNPDYPYIVVNDLPKIEALKHLFPENYRDKPALVSE
ncbi:MAG: peptide-methionine (S)-S-oxide reductase MsrA [Methylocystis sp.]